MYFRVDTRQAVVRQPFNNVEMSRRIGEICLEKMHDCLSFAWTGIGRSGSACLRSTPLRRYHTATTQP